MVIGPWKPTQLEAVPLTSPVGDCEEIDPGAVWPARFLAAACSVADYPNSKLKASNKFNGSLGTATLVAVIFWHFFFICIFIESLLAQSLRMLF